MSYDEIDAWNDAAMDAMYEQVMGDPNVRDQFYQELYDTIVVDFTEARLRSYYEAHPDVATVARHSLTEAVVLIGEHASAALVFAATAAELALRATLLAPVVYGLVHADTAAALITKLAIGHKDERFVKVLLDLLAAHGGADPRTHRRPGSRASIWEELASVKMARNDVVHEGAVASREVAELAIGVATGFLDELFPVVVAKLGLQLRGDLVTVIAPPVLGGRPGGRTA